MEEKIKNIFELKNIAVVGLSKNPEKPSYKVAMYLKNSGFKIIPVNPTAEGEILGEKVWKNLMEIDENIDIVDVFRPSEEALKVVEEAIKRKKEKGDIKVIWLQEGIVNEKAKEIAEKEGIIFVQDKCMMKEHRKIS